MTIKQIGMQGARAGVLALCGLMVNALPVMAQNAPPPPAAGDQGPGRPDQAQMEARQLERMTQQLNLTPDQVTQVKAIQDGQRTQMMALRNDTSVPREDRRSKMMAIRQDTEGKIRGVLTDEQKPKYDAMQAHRQERMERREGGAPAAPAPPQ